jgi:hypothetical protein
MKTLYPLHYEIHASTTPESLHAKLNEALVPKKGLMWSARRFEYQGVISKDGFRIQRNVKLGRSVELCGDIHQAGDVMIISIVAPIREGLIASAGARSIPILFALILLWVMADFHEAQIVWVVSILSVVIVGVFAATVFIGRKGMEYDLQNEVGLLTKFLGSAFTASYRKVEPTVG